MKRQLGLLMPCMASMASMTLGYALQASLGNNAGLKGPKELGASENYVQNKLKGASETKSI